MKATLYFNGVATEVDATPTEIAELTSLPGWSALPMERAAHQPVAPAQASAPVPTLSGTETMTAQIAFAVVYQKNPKQLAVALYDDEDTLANGNIKEYADYQVWQEEFKGPISQAGLDFTNISPASLKRQAARGSQFAQPINRAAVFMPKVRNGMVAYKKSGYPIWQLYGWADVMPTQEPDLDYPEEEDEIGDGWRLEYAGDNEAAYNWSKKYIGTGEPPITEDELQGLWLATAQEAKVKKVKTAKLWYPVVIGMLAERDDEVPF